jgi:hypothetical protein
MRFPHHDFDGSTNPFREDPMRFFPRPLRFWTALAMLVYWCGIDVAPAAAGLAPSQPTGVTAIASSRDADLVAVQRALENRIVAQKLRDYGVAPQAVQARLASLEGRDLHTLATVSKGLPSGGDAIGVVVGLLVVTILVIVILKLMNKQVVIK